MAAIIEDADLVNFVQTVRAVIKIPQAAHAQIAVVTVKSLDGQDVVSYAVALYQKWGIGAKGKDRGVLILLATQDRKYWTAVGYGLEPILPDGKVGGFGREAVPLLRKGDYDGAVSLMTSRVAEVIATDAGVTLEGLKAAPEPRGAQGDSKPGIPVALALFLIFLFIVWVFRRAGGGGYRGGGGVHRGGAVHAGTATGPPRCAKVERGPARERQPASGRRG